eukprot:COSAG01_NODE_7700_length_3093_cov_1.525718_1_plen_86_part_00
MCAYDCRPANLVAAALPGVRLVGVAVMGLLLLVLALVLTGLLLPARVAAAAAANRTVSPPNILFFLADGAEQPACMQHCDALVYR